MNDSQNLVSQIIQDRLCHLKYNYDKLWLGMMSATTGEAKTAKIHDLLPLGNEMSFLSGLLNDVIQERKEAKECVLIGCEAVQEAVNIVDELFNMVPLGYFKTPVCERAYEFIKNYKTVKK